MYDCHIVISKYVFTNINNNSNNNNINTEDSSVLKLKNKQTNKVRIIMPKKKAKLIEGKILLIRPVSHRV